MELPIVSVNAMALKYDSGSSQWIELGSESGLCTLTILKSPTNEYRYIAQKISNNEFVMNAYIYPEMKYDESTATFHQWFDKNKVPFGLNFADVNMAKKFAAGITCALEQLNTPQNTPKATTPGIDRSTFSTTPNNVAKKLPDNPSRGGSKVSPYATTPVGNNIAQSPPSAAPKVTAVKASAGAPPPPGPPPSAPAPPGPPPPGPAPPKAPGGAGNDFASQLRKKAEQHKDVDIEGSLNKTRTVVPEPKAEKAAPTGGGMDFLSEMKLKMQKKGGNDSSSATPVKANTMKPTPTYATNVNNTQSQMTKQQTLDPEPSSSTYVTAAALEKFRVDLMNDIIENMEKMKNEIISSISAKLN